jgi:hypothetical protein
LVKTLQQFDAEDGLAYVSELPEGSRFLLPPRRVFVKGHKVRSRYNCVNEANKKPYLISAIARVMPL